MILNEGTAGWFRSLHNRIHLLEGGWDDTATQKTKLVPQMVKAALEIIDNQFIKILKFPKFS